MYLLNQVVEERQCHDLHAELTQLLTDETFSFFDRHFERFCFATWHFHPD